MANNMADIAPNVFINENGELMVVNIISMPDPVIDALDVAKNVVERTEKKYGTNNIAEMFRKGISKTEIQRYIWSIKDLAIWGYM